MYLNIPVGLWNRMKLDLIPLWVWIWKPDLIFLSSPDLVYKGTQALAIPAWRAVSWAVHGARSHSPLPLVPPSKLGLWNLVGRVVASQISASRWPINVLLMNKLESLFSKHLIFYCSFDIVLKVWYNHLFHSLLLRELAEVNLTFPWFPQEMLKWFASWVWENHICDLY